MNAIALLAVCMTAWSGAHAAGVKPTAGRLLVAQGGQPGVFSRSVVLLIAYGPNGAMGLIVNRPTKVPLAKALVNPRGLNGRSGLLYFGGPVALDHLTLLIRANKMPSGAFHVVGHVYASGSATTLRAIVTGKLPGAHFRGYAGYAGWAPGQLDSEIARGGWKILPATDDDVFSTDPTSLWNELIRQPELQLTRVSRPTPVVQTLRSWQ
ncbi:MAG: YqgE/AlgH family protein [Gammaproteobacteria bacterium]